ncbi:MAG: class I adenylate cyclase [bacterium]
MYFNQKQLLLLFPLQKFDDTKGVLKPENRVEDGVWIEYFNKGRKIFTDYNQRYIELLRNQLPQAKRDVFDIIPFLLHEDYSELPGNKPNEYNLSGISRFTYTPELKAVIKKYFPHFTINENRKLRVCIEFLAIMGSAGTLAFTSQSDIDFWVGIETEKYKPDFINTLEVKFRALEKWSMDMAKLEIHFFISDLNKIRHEDYGELGGESCGTALGKLLKDEFYRTAIFLQGKMPFYWLMPFGTNDADYKDWISKLQSHQAFPHLDFVDLGNINKIDASEYFGAAIWHVLKSLQAPFKSVIKIALLDKYSCEGDGAFAICELFKKEVMESQPENLPDPYLFLIEKVCDFYGGMDDYYVKRLLEKCFFIKCLLTVGIAAFKDPKRLEIFYKIGEKWGWRKSQILDIANFNNWNFKRNEDLRDQILRYIISTYKNIRSRTREAGVFISERDMAVAGKKLQSFFEWRQDKVPYEFSLLQANEISTIILEEEKKIDGNSKWMINVVIKGATCFHLQTLKILDDPTIALAWCSLNQIYHNSQYFKLKSKAQFSNSDAIHLIQSLDLFFPKKEVAALSSDDLEGNPHITHLYILPNWNNPNWQYGIISIYVFFMNIIMELFHDNYYGKDCFTWFVNNILMEKVGKKNLSGLEWAVHIPRERISARRKLIENFAGQLQIFMAKTLK